MAPTRLARLVASAARRPRTKRRRRERPRRVGSRLPARVRPSRATQAKVRPLWRVEGDPRMGRPRTTRLPARKRRQRFPMRSRHRRSRRPPPRLSGSRRHLALRRRPISAPPRSGPHLPLTPSPPPGRTHRRPVSARPPPTGLRRPRVTSLRRPPSGHRDPRPRHRGPGSATPRPVQWLGRRHPVTNPGRNRTRRLRRRHLNCLRLRPLDPMGNPGLAPVRRRRRRRPGRPRLPPLDPIGSPDGIRATMPGAALATRRRPGRPGPGPRVLAGRMSALQPPGPSTEPRPPRPGTPLATTWRLRRLRRPDSPSVAPWMRRRLDPPIGRCLLGPRMPGTALWTRWG
jgi:hypothetical protein